MTMCVHERKKKRDKVVVVVCVWGRGEGGSTHVHACFLMVSALLR